MKQMFDNKQILSKLKQVQKDFDAKNKSSSPLLATIRTIDINAKQSGVKKITQRTRSDQTFFNTEKRKSGQPNLIDPKGRHTSPEPQTIGNASHTETKDIKSVFTCGKNSSLSKNDKVNSVQMMRNGQNASIFTQTFQTTTCSLAENSQRNTRMDKDSS